MIHVNEAEVGPWDKLTGAELVRIPLEGYGLTCPVCLDETLVDRHLLGKRTARSECCEDFPASTEAIREASLVFLLTVVPVKLDFEFIVRKWMPKYPARSVMLWSKSAASCERTGERVRCQATGLVATVSVNEPVVCQWLLLTGKIRGRFVSLCAVLL